MLGMGLTLTLEDFKRVVTYPKAVVIGLVAQLIVLPIVGFGIASVFPLNSQLAVGVMILAACPGGATNRCRCGVGNSSFECVAMALGFAIATLTRLGEKRVTAITVEVGIQNGTLAIAIASTPTLLNSTIMAIPGAIYGLLMFVTCAGFA